MLPYLLLLEAAMEIDGVASFSCGSPAVSRGRG